MPSKPAASAISRRRQRVFVSGGGSGIGAAFVRAFAAQGCKVAFCRHRRRGIAARSLTSSARPRCASCACDVRDIEALRDDARAAAALSARSRS